MAYGAADFLGGLASRRTAAATVVLGAQALGLPVLALLLLVAPGGEPTARALALGAVAGTAGGAGVALLFRGLALGTMSVVAPVTAVGAAVLPVAWGLTHGERPGAVVLVGVALAVVAVGLVAGAPSDDAARDDADDGRALLLAVAAGLCFGTLFVVLGETDPDSGLWPLLGARVASVAVVAAGALVARAALVPPRAVAPTVVGCGALDLVANVLYVLAVRRGLLSLVAVLSSLYPAATVVLARVVLHERLARAQAAGLGLALVGVYLIAAG